VCRPLGGRNGDTVAGVIIVVDHLEPLASASSGCMDA